MYWRCRYKVPRVLKFEGELFASSRLLAWKKPTVTTEQAVCHTPSTKLGAHTHRLNTNVPNSAGAGTPIVRSVDSHCNDGGIPDPKYLSSLANNCFCIWIRSNRQISTRKLVIRGEMFAKNSVEIKLISRQLLFINMYCK